MPDLGIEVLFKGKNMLRLLGGLWTALRISLIAVVISIPLGILLGVLMTKKNRIAARDPARLSGIHPHHAADGSAVPRLFRNDTAPSAGISPERWRLSSYSSCGELQR